MYQLFALTAYGLEELLKQELQQLGANSCQVVQCGVLFQGDADLLYRSLLWCRIASRILLRVATFTVTHEQHLYQGAVAVDWPALFALKGTFAVYFTGTSTAINNSQYGALRIKDAIVDRFNQQLSQRPSVDKQHPDIRIDGHLQHDRVTLSLDLSGKPLHQRGYRQATGPAQLKENLAAAIIVRSGWKPGTSLIDPMCGAGTLLIEAAMLAADIAPGLQRQQWGFTAWSQYQPERWEQMHQQAKQRAMIGLARYQGGFWGYDSDGAMLQKARHNAQQAGVAELITFEVADATTLPNRCTSAHTTTPHSSGSNGTLVSNPPYGKRLSCQSALIACYSAFAHNLKQHFAGWRLSLFSGDPTLLSHLRLRAERQFNAMNGPLACVQKNYQISSQPTTSASSGATEFANRLAKNQLKLSRWAQREGVDSYRLYDADLPNYNVAIDRYADYLVVQEYQPPSTIDANKRQQHLAELLNATLAVTKLPADHVIVKVRQRQRGRSQYQKLAQQSEWFPITEYGAKLWVNLTDYLDSGLFLDHRRTRRLLGKLAAGKDFLNLFCYTASATVQVGLGGARSTTSVDLSNTYLEWAARNLRSNGLCGQQHRLIQADCLGWLADCQQQFDIILVDPPTFSNSKRMSQTFAVQRDHGVLLTQLRRLLRPQGVLLFSSNCHGFKLDQSILPALQLTAEMITTKTQSPDFSRQRSRHHCWLLRQQEWTSP